MSPVITIPTTTGGTVKGGLAPHTGLTPILAPTSTGGKLQPRNKDYNVVMLILDDVGAEKFQAYNATTGNTNPVIRIPSIKTHVQDRGITFRRYFGAPTCGPTRAGCETGLYGHHSGQFTNILDTLGPLGGDFYLGQDPLDMATTTKQMLQCIPQAVRVGRPTSLYKLAKFGKSHLQPVSGFDNYMTRNEGWDEFHGQHGNHPSHYASWDHIDSVKSPASTVRTTLTNVFAAQKEKDDIIAWLATVGTRPFVLWWCPNVGHSPYETPDPTKVSALSQGDWTTAFGGTYPTLGTDFSFPSSVDVTEKAKRVMTQKHQIECVDTLFGEIITQLQAAGQYDNTMFIVISDNGTDVATVEAPYDDTHAKRAAYPQGVQCFCAMGGPLIGGGPGFSNGLVNMVDIYETIVDICGVYTQASDAVVNSGFQRGRDGYSILSHLRDRTLPTGRTYNFSLRGGTYVGYGWDAARRLYVTNPTNSVWILSDGTYSLIRLGGVTVTEKLFLATDFKCPDANDLLVTDPTNPLVVAARSNLSSQLNTILNS